MRPVILALVLAITGCSSPTTQRPSSNDDPSAACFFSIPSEPELQPIAHKIPLVDPRRTTVEQLADPFGPTLAEKTALSAWGRLRTECTERGRTFRAQYAPPGWATAFEVQQLSIMQAIAQLYSGASYGWFNQERQKINAAAAAAMNAAARADDAARRQRAIEQQAATLLFLQSIRPAPAVNCTSVRTGNVTQTDCR